MILGAIRMYRRFVSPALPATCRYLPSCSAYAEEAVRVHGVAKGLLLATARIARCHPWGGHGVDLVPPAPQRKGV